MDCRPATLIHEARCYRCIPQSALIAARNYLLCQWANTSVTPVTIYLEWTPHTESVSWVDSGGLRVGDYTNFVANVDIATLTSLDFSGSIISTLTGLATVPTLTGLTTGASTLATLNLTGCAALQNLSTAGSLALQTITGLTTCSALITATFDNCDIRPTLDAHGLIHLVTLIVSSNLNLVTVNIQGCPLVTLYSNFCPSLTTIIT